MADTTVIADGMSWNAIPTCIEAGLDIKSFAQPRTIWAAKGLPPEALAYYTNLLRKVAQTEEFKGYMARGAQIPRTLTGDELKAFIARHRATYAEYYKNNGWLKGAVD